MIKLGVVSLEHPHAEGNHFPALKYLANRIKVAAIYNRTKEPAEKWLELFKADFHDQAESLLLREDIDAILITSRNIDHAKHAIAAAEAGKDIFCDKPVATTVEDAQKIVAAVRKANVRFITTFPVRFNTSVLHLRNAVKEGRLGRITGITATNHGCMYEPGEPDWVRDPVLNGGGCIIDHTVHVADIIRWITESEFEEVRAEAATSLRKQNTEDIGMLQGTMSDGSLFQIDASWTRKGHNPMWGDVTFRVAGTKGSATLDLYNNQRMEIYSASGMEMRYPNHLIREHGEVFLDYANAKEKGTGSLAADEIDGLRTIELVHAAYRSVCTGKRVKVYKWN